MLINNWIRTCQPYSVHKSFPDVNLLKEFQTEDKIIENQWQELGKHFDRQGFRAHGNINRYMQYAYVVKM